MNIEDFNEKVSKCKGCDLHKNRNLVVVGRGNPNSDVVFIGEAPGMNEDLEGIAFVGKSGKLHDKMLKRAGYSKNDFYITNVCRCRPPKNRIPTKEEYLYCSDEWLWEELSLVNPKSVVLLGATALKAWFGGAYIGVMKMFSERFDDVLYEGGPKVSVFCAYHPSYLLRNDDYIEQQINIYKRAKIFAETGVDPKEEIANRIKQDIFYPVDTNKNLDSTNLKLFEADNVSDRISLCWSIDNTIYFLKKTKDGKKKVVSKRFEHYVCMRKRDYRTILSIDKNAFSSYIKRGLLTKIVEDEINKKWMRLYVNLKGYKSRVVARGTEEWSENPGMKLYREIGTDYGVKLYEADIDPPIRYLIDNNIGVYSYEDYKFLYFDIETNDDGGIDVGNMRILSIAWGCPQTNEYGFDWADNNNDSSERDLLKRFKKVADEYDILVAWNGDSFDFPELMERSFLYGIKFDVKKLMSLDHMKVFENFYKKSDGKITSLALDNVAKVVLGDERGKINIGYICPKCKKHSSDSGICSCGGFKRKKKIKELYNEWISEENDILEEYNSEDVKLMIDIEKKTGLIQTLVTMNYFSGVFVDELKPSPKIDSLMLRVAHKNGVRFKTKIGMGVSDATLMGAYVLPSKAGFHKSVCVLDFASMYPSIYRTFNICPTTLVKEWEYSKYSEDEYIRTPESICLTKGCTYVIDEWKENQYCPKCKKGPMLIHDIRFVKNRAGFVPNISKWTSEQRNELRKKQKEYDVGTDEYMGYERRAYAMKQLGLCFYGDLGNIYSRYYHPEIAGTITKIARFIIFKTLEWLSDEKGYEIVLCDTDSAYIIPHTDIDDFKDLDLFVENVNSEINTLLVEYSNYIEPILKSFNIKENFVELEFETIYSPIIIAEAKKRYAGKIVYRKGKITDKIEIKGLEAIRTDQLPIAKQMQREIINNVLNYCPLSKTINYIEKMREMIIFGRLPINLLIISKGLSKDTDSYYGDVIDSKTGKAKVKSDGTVQKKSPAVHVKVAEWLKYQNKEFYVGMRIPYVIIGTKPKLIGIHAEDYFPVEFEDIDDILNYECEAVANNKFGFDLSNYFGGYDPIYYWDRATFPCLERLLKIAYPNFNWKKYYLKEEAKIRGLEKRYMIKLKSLKTAKAVENNLKKILEDNKLSKEAILNLSEFARERIANLKKKKEKAVSIF